LGPSQACLAGAQRLTQTGSWAYDPGARRVIYWSDEAFRIFGLDPGRGSLPAPDELQRLVDTEGAGRFVGGDRTAVRGTGEFAIECRLLLPGGTVKHVQTVGHPVLDGTGRVVEWLGTLVDVTERKRAEDEHRGHVWFLESMDRINRAIHGTNALDPTLGALLSAAPE